jgi:membrane protein required for colicin V production
MSWFDISLSLVMLVGGIKSYFHGLTREVMSTIGLLAVFVFAVWGHVSIARYLEPLVASPWWRQIAGYVVLLIVAIGAYMLWANLVERLLHVSRLSIPDRVLGGLFGIVKVGVVMAALLVLLIQAMPERVATVVPGSKLAPPLLQTARAIAMVLPGDVRREFLRHYSRIRPQFGRQVAQPPQTAPSTFRSQPPQPSAEPSENDDRAMRRLIKKHAKKP